MKGEGLTLLFFWSKSIRLPLSYHCSCHSSSKTVVRLLQQLWNKCDNSLGTTVTTAVEQV